LGPRIHTLSSDTSLLDKVTVLKADIEWTVTIYLSLLCGATAVGPNHSFCLYCSKSNSHDKEVQKLYEEMEQQIRTEKERIHNEVTQWFQFDN